MRGLVTFSTYGDYKVRIFRFVSIKKIKGGDRIMGMLDITDETIRSVLPGGYIECPECGKRIEADETECPECGAEL